MKNPKIKIVVSVIFLTAIQLQTTFALHTPSGPQEFLPPSKTGDLTGPMANALCTDLNGQLDNDCLAGLTLAIATNAAGGGSGASAGGSSGYSSNNYPNTNNQENTSQNTSKSQNPPPQKTHNNNQENPENSTAQNQSHKNSQNNQPSNSTQHNAPESVLGVSAHRNNLQQYYNDLKKYFNALKGTISSLFTQKQNQRVAYIDGALYVLFIVFMFSVAFYRDHIYKKFLRFQKSFSKRKK